MRLVPVLAMGAVLSVAAIGGCGRSEAPSAVPTTSPTAAPSSSTAPATSAPVTPTAKPSTPGTKPTATAVPLPRALLGTDIVRIGTARKVVALTFDAGANADGLGSILATLAAKRVTATFFLTGDFAAGFPAQSRRIRAAGHRLGNHSVDHPHFPRLTDAQIRAQLGGAAQTIMAVTGTDPAPLFRFPFGDRTAHAIAVVNSAGYLAVRWTVDSLGWQGTMNGTRDATFVTERVVAAAVPGAIVLMHVGSHPTDHSTLDAAALPAVIDRLRARGYSFVTLDALLH
jgi:peptidoglycan/xylan/chitin deacetylase (PgdA/CDA1 family)